MARASTITTSTAGLKERHECCFRRSSGPLSSSWHTFWIALSSKRDQHHSPAVEWHEFVVRSGSKILTTEVVLWEWLNTLSDPATRGVGGRGLSASARGCKRRGSATSDGIDRRRSHPLRSASRQGLELDGLLFFRGHGAMARYGSANHRSSFRAGKPESGETAKWTSPLSKRR
jgi:hypothetical protein